MKGEKEKDKNKSCEKQIGIVNTASSSISRKGCYSNSTAPGYKYNKRLYWKLVSRKTIVKIATRS